MKHVYIAIGIGVLTLPLISSAATADVRSYISTRTGGYVAEGQAGEDGKSNSVVVSGTDGQSVSVSRSGKDGASGKSGAVIEGGSSSRVDVYTEVNGKVIEDSHTSIVDGDQEYVRERVYDDGATTVRTSVTVQATQSAASTTRKGSAPNRSFEDAVTDTGKKQGALLRDMQALQGIFGETYPFISQFTQENTDGRAPYASAAQADTTSAFTGLRQIFKNLLYHVATIF